MSHANRRRTGPDHCHDLLAARRRAAFTIIEMLVVLAVVALIVAILLPAIAGVRNAAGKSKTQSTVTSLMQASQQFLSDNRRLPGYFTPEEMGDPQNASRGFPMMANILLDLSGGVVAPGDTVPAGLNPLRVGPSGGSEVEVIVERIGATEGVGAAKSLYYTPEGSSFQLQNEMGQMSTSVTDHTNLPQLTDAFGTPLLAWAESEIIDPSAEFAAVDSGGAGAKFYWASNAAFLNTSATVVGRKGNNQYAESLLGASRSASDRAKTMEALLGNPSYPSNDTPPEPTAPRGKLVFHAAGPNGLFIGENEPASKTALGTALQYSGSDDPMRRTDDVIRSLGD